MYKRQHLHCGADVLPSVSVPGGDQSAAGGVGAVSYTHLDVYKRQALRYSVLGYTPDSVASSLENVLCLLYTSHR